MPRRRDRPAGRRSAHLRAVLSQPTGGRRIRPTGEARRTARGPAPRSRHAWALAAAVLLTTACAIGVYAVRTASVSGEVRPLAEARGDYDRLAGLLAETCGDEPCGLGNLFATDPPADVRSLMARLRVRTAEHDPIYAETRLRGTIAATHDLVYHHPAAPDVVALRARRTAFFARQESLRATRRVVGRYDAPEPLGGGWWRVPGSPVTRPGRSGPSG